MALRQGHQEFATTLAAPVRSSAARAALDFTGAANLAAGTCWPSSNLPAPPRNTKKTRVLGEESGLRPLGVKQRYAVPEHLYRRATWGGCAAPTLQVLARFGAVPVHIGRFLNRFGIRQRFIPPATHGRKHRETQTCVDDPCNFPQVRHNKPLRLSSSPSHAERTS